MKGVYTKYLGKPNSPGLGVRWREAVQALLFEGAPLEARLCEHARLVMDEIPSNGHFCGTAWQWRVALLRLGSAISIVSLGSHALQAPLMQTGSASLYLLLCPAFARAAGERAEPSTLEGPSLPVAVDGCCSSTREGSRLPAGSTLASGWREDADLASAGASTEAPGTWHCTHTVRGVATACHPDTAAATSQPLSHPESLDVPRGHQHKMDMWLPTLASPTHGTGSCPAQVGDFGISCPQAWSPWKGARIQTGKT